MMESGFKRGWIDRAAIAVSGLCLAHCIGSAILVAFLASAGHALGGEHVHEFGLMLAILLGALGLGHGVLAHGAMLPSSIGSLGLGMMGGALNLPHGGAEMAYTMAGVSVLALGHFLNYRAHR